MIKVIKENEKGLKSVAIIVAHPDDETLWAGGTILSHPSWKCFIICLCRGNDSDRAPKFYEALNVLKSEGIMGDLDDGPEQKPLGEEEVEAAILELLPSLNFDLIITHNLAGEYTKHLRHEETSKAALTLWQNGKLTARQFWTFAYEDGNKKYYPRAIETAPGYKALTKRIWSRKYSIITEIYGFKKESWEAETTPLAESFWQFTDPYEEKKWLNQYKNEKPLRSFIL
jgi:LmbE family N-acetylglucosaminyl deacetylase